ncbi:hypothetical protein [Granulicella sp. dw_53]|uniref:hypothetical protein n=1 Tax=Granulicella sp. dw_53 TaxID=2719792 RepID=UPI001BD26953|nr:hypothetical protein [Granulicella sp. dw_53]
MPILRFTNTPLLMATLGLASVLPAAAQTAASTVVYVSGDALVVKRADSKIFNYTIPASYRFTVAGKQLGLDGLKPGTQLTEPITAPSPKVVSDVSVVKGKVYLVSPPDKVTLSLTEGIKELTVPAGTTFTQDGKSVTIAQLQKGTLVEATMVTTLDTEDASGTTPPQTPPQSGALLISATAGESSLPVAGTHLPLFGILGFIILAAGLALRSNRFSRSNA